MSLPHLKTKPGKYKYLDPTSKNIDFPRGFEAWGGACQRVQQPDSAPVWPAWALREAHHCGCPIPGGLSRNPRNSRSQKNCAALFCPALGSPPAQPPAPQAQNPSGHVQCPSEQQLFPKQLSGWDRDFIYLPLGWLTFPNENTSIKADLIMLMASDNPSPQSGRTRINLSSSIP